jgi:hypothetical protein
MTMPGGAAGALSAARLLGRNWPLVLFLVMIGALFWPTDVSSSEEDAVGWTQAQRLRRADAQRAEALKVSMPRGAWGARSDVARCLSPLQYQIDLDGTPKQHYAA